MTDGEIASRVLTTRARGVLFHILWCDGRDELPAEARSGGGLADDTWIRERMARIDQMSRGAMRQALLEQVVRKALSVEHLLLRTRNCGHLTCREILDWLALEGDRVTGHGRAHPGPMRVPVCLCGKEGVRDDKADSYYCPETGVWLEQPCHDLKCHYCLQRPPLAPIEDR
jgi:hypothetical protein